MTEVTISGREMGSEILPEETAPRYRELCEQIGTSLSIHYAMMRRILAEDPHPSAVLGEVLEDAANRYMNFAEEVRRSVLRG